MLYSYLNEMPRAMPLRQQVGGCLLSSVVELMAAL